MESYGKDAHGVEAPAYNVERSGGAGPCLTHDEYSRYSRQLIMKEIGLEG